MTPEETWLPERLERAKRAAVQEVLAQVGFEAVEDLQTAVAQLPALTAERDELAKRLQEAEATRQQTYLEAAFLYEASRYRFINLDEARILLDWHHIHLNEAEEVEGLREALDQLVKERPHLVRRPAAPHLDSETHGTGRFTPRRVEDMPTEQVEALKRRFKLW